MAKNRKAAEALCLNVIEAMLPGSENTKLYKDKFENMGDDEFDLFIDDLKNDRVQLAIIAPNFGKPHLNFERNLDVCEKLLNHNCFQRVWIPATENTPKYLTPIPHLVLDLPYRRQAQMVDHKVSVSEDNNSVDDFTGQPTGRSKSSSISYPQIQVLAARGKVNTLVEFLKYRGGDQKGFQAMNTMVARTGGVSQKAIEPYSGEVKSTASLRTIFTGMHLETTF